MKHQPSDESVHVTGEERVHPALRKLGRACIALARWQREHQATAPEQPATPPPNKPPGTSPALRADADGQEARDAGA